MWLVKAPIDTLVITSHTILQVAPCTCLRLGKERGLLVDRFFHVVRERVQNLFEEAINVDLSRRIKVKQSAALGARRVDHTLAQQAKTLLAFARQSGDWRALWHGAPTQLFGGNGPHIVAASGCQLLFLCLMRGALPLPAQPEAA